MTCHRHQGPVRNPSRPGWRRRVWRVLLGAVVLAAVTHPLWLRAYGEFLVADEPVARTDVAVILSGDHRVHHAAELLHGGTVSEIWLLEQEPTYAVSVGILPPMDEVEFGRLAEMGVPDEQIRVIDGGMRDVDDAARMVKRAMSNSPYTTALVLCDRIHSGNLRMVLDEVFRDGSSGVVAITALSADRYNEENWWRSRTGWKDTFNATCQVLFTKLHGVDADDNVNEWDPDVYERQVIATYGENGCDAGE